MFAKSLCLLVILLGFQLAPSVSLRTTSRPERLPLRSTQAAVIKAPVPSTPLWPGSRFTDLDRTRALSRGLRYIYRIALNRRSFAQDAADYLWCFYTLSAAVQDENLKLMAHSMGVKRALDWRRLHRSLPRHADPDTIIEYAFASDAADSLGVPDESLKEQIRQAANRYSARDYLDFDPVIEPPPADVPDDCEYDGGTIRGAARSVMFAKGGLR